MRAAVVWALMCGAAIAVLVAMACIDVEDGERGEYGSPCSLGTFSELLLCDRGTGGSDPESGKPSPGNEPFGCAEACQRFFDCRLLDGSDIDNCTLECVVENTPQSLLDCIERSGCNFQGCTG